MVMRQIQYNFGKQTSTPAKIAILVFGIVLLLPILALAIVAGLVASVVFALLFTFARVRFAVRKMFSRSRDNEGRKNVRIKK